MGATSDDLMDIARAGAGRIDMPDERLRYPSFSDIEEQCAAEYDELLDLLHEDELFQPVDVQRQEEAVEKLKMLVGEQNEALVEDLVDNQTRHLWLHQEAAFHLGMAVGLRLAEGRRQ
jgi:dsDNA-binding SOS-regulon protein